VLAGLVAGYQLLVNNGQGFSVSEIGVVFSAGFSVAFVKGLVPLRNNPKVVEQAALDTLSQIQAAHPQVVQQALQQVVALFQQQQAQAGAIQAQVQPQPPVNITIHPPVPVTVTQDVAQQVKPASVIPQRPQAPVQQPVPVSNPQSIPVVDMAQLTTAQTPATAGQAPALSTPVDFGVQRSWNTSQVMPVVGQ
jgi:type II secretory pathway pseudopilin PulG